jgi:N6-L-threonylcarbamoyladenine synthase
MISLGFDTSNYTTSIAYYSNSHYMNCSQLLPVKEGQLGLRQSDAVFHHTRSLPELSGRLFCDLDIHKISCVGVSVKPRMVEGSYMPCFSVGYSHAVLFSDALHVPLITCSHQQGHVAAALYSAGRPELMDQPHLAWHLSGGTTELLLVEPDRYNVRCTKIGGTTDISAGQLIDRTGQLLGLPFPAGKHLDQLSENASGKDCFRVKCNDLYFSLSGIQNKVQKYYENNRHASETAGYALRCICGAVIAVTEEALNRYSGLPVVFSGGVASNTMLRTAFDGSGSVFAPPEYSKDNALGVAIIAHRALEG